MSSTDTKYLSFVGNQGSAEFGNDKIIIQDDFLAIALIDIVEMNIFGTPFEVMNKLASAITFL